MPQGELWEAIPRDKLRAEAFERTPWGKKMAQEFHDYAMQCLNQRVKLGYASTAEEQKDLEEWRKEKAQLENTSVE